jgi:hypothetical protein
MQVTRFVFFHLARTAGAGAGAGLAHVHLKLSAPAISFNATKLNEVT